MKSCLFLNIFKVTRNKAYSRSLSSLGGGLLGGILGSLLGGSLLGHLLGDFLGSLGGGSLLCDSLSSSFCYKG